MDFNQALRMVSPTVAQWSEAAQKPASCPGGTLCRCEGPQEHYEGLLKELRG